MSIPFNMSMSAVTAETHPLLAPLVHSLLVRSPFTSTAPFATSNKHIAGKHGADMPLAHGRWHVYLLLRIPAIAYTCYCVYLLLCIPAIAYTCYCVYLLFC